MLISSSCSPKRLLRSVRLLVRLLVRLAILLAIVVTRVTALELAVVVSSPVTEDVGVIVVVEDISVFLDG